MTPGTEVAIVHGPVSCAAVNQTPAGNRVVAARAHLDERDRRIGDVGQRRRWNRRILRRPVEARRELRTVLERHGGRLRNRVGDHRFLRLRRACHRRQHGRRERALRNLREAGRQRVAGDERPRSGQRGGAEPAAGEQHVVVVASGVDQHVVGRVRRPQQLRADDRNEIGLALEHDQLGRALRRVDRRHTVRPARASDLPWGRHRADRPCRPWKAPARSCSSRFS